MYMIFSNYQLIEICIIVKRIAIFYKPPGPVIMYCVTE